MNLAETLKSDRESEMPWLPLRSKGKTRVVVAAVLALMILGPPSLLLVRAARIGDMVVLDRRLAQVKPGVMAGAVPGGEVFVQGLQPGVALPDGAPKPTVQVRLSSAQRSRILVIQPIEPKGQARLVWPQDGEYFALGPCPPAAAVYRFRVTSLSPEAGWGLVPALPLTVNKLDVNAGPHGTAVDYRIVASQPVAVGECLARFTFFLWISRVALLCFIAGVASLALGLTAYSHGRVPLATAGVVTALMMFYVSLTPPFQAADETSHIATLEYAAAGGPKGLFPYWPASITIATRALDQDRVQYAPEEALPIRSTTERSRVAGVLTRSLHSEALLEGIPSREAVLFRIAQRSATFFFLPRLLPSQTLSLSVINRIYCYRALGAVVGLMAALLGVLALRLARQPDQAFWVLIALVALPEWAAIASSASNYAPGLGFSLLAGCLALNSLQDRAALNPGWLVASCGAAAAGGFFLRDDFLVAAALAALVVFGVFLGLVHAFVRRDRSRAFAAAFWATGALGTAVVAFFLFPKLGPANLAWALSSLRKPVGVYLGARQVALALSPIACVAVFLFVHRVVGASRRRDVAIGSSLLMLLALLLASLFSDGRVPTSALVEGWTPATYSQRFLEASAGTFLTWDQDFFAWKTLFGALGWHDVIYPQWMYATARWVATGILLALPFAYRAAALRIPRVACWSAFFAACGGSVFLGALVLRGSYTMIHGRFLLFALPLMVLPLARLASNTLGKWLAFGLATLGVALSFYTVFYLLPLRYFFAGAGQVCSLLP